MDFLGIGPLELLFVVIIALIVLGPKDMVKAGKTIGRLLRSIVTSPNWRAIQQTSQEIRHLPNRLMREAGMEEIQKNLPSTDELARKIGVNEVSKDLSQVGKGLSDWTTPPETSSASLPEEENKILPPAIQSEKTSSED